MRDVSAAYWRGSSDNKSLQRIYGYCFESEERLEGYLNFLEEVSKRDHRKLGKALGLIMSEKASVGSTFWLPKGMILRRIVEDFSREEQLRDGYNEIKTPTIMNRELWEKSGHWDNYRENMAFLKVSLGTKGKDRQRSYTLVLGHGASKNKTNKFGYSIDGMDVLITGHTHTPSVDFPAKIVIDAKNNHVGIKDYMHLVVPSFQRMGGYALKGMYAPTSTTKIPVLKLSGVRKEVRVEWL